MRIVAVDDEALLLERLVESITEATADMENVDIFPFDDSEVAAGFCIANPVDILFCDINMGELDGMSMAKAVLKEKPDMDIIFTTGYSEFSLQAWELNASGYIMKPINTAKVKKALNNLRNYKVNANDKRLVAQCFGNFEVYYDGVPVRFKYNKTKELLGYLISRNGAMCSKDEIIVNLWEDDDKSDYFRKIKKDLNDTFDSFGMKDTIVSQRGYVGIIKEDIDCDYYKLLSGELDSTAYTGEFMAQYFWGEDVNGYLYDKFGK